MKTAKRVFAIIGIAALVALYLVTLLCAIFYKQGLQTWFTVSAYCTVIIPTVIYAFMMLCNVFVKRNNDGKLPDEARKTGTDGKLSDKAQKADTSGKPSDKAK